jgi:hypothetical protein
MVSRRGWQGRSRLRRGLLISTKLGGRVSTEMKEVDFVPPAINTHSNNQPILLKPTVSFIFKPHNISYHQLPAESDSR